MASVYLYALVDPRSDTLRYVGMTKSPLARLKQHIKDSRRNPNRNKRCAWVASLLNAGTRPEMVVLEEDPAEGWRLAEQFWIDYFRAIGCDLVNGLDGGIGVESFSPDVRAKMRESHRGDVPCWVGKPRPPEWAAGTMRNFVATDPRGQEYGVIHLNAFCQAYGLSQRGLWLTLLGRIHHHHGWRLRRAEDPAPSQVYILQHRDGRQETTTDLTQWCLDLGMKQHDGFTHVLNGRRSHCKGWTIRRAD